MNKEINICCFVAPWIMDLVRVPPIRSVIVAYPPVATGTMKVILIKTKSQTY
jgi:hypothetical protein